MLHLHRAERADVLVEALGDVLRDVLGDPLQAEVVSVPTRGVERWLTQRLAHRLGASGDARSDGVCANVEFPFPGRLVGDAMAAACGIGRDEDPWRPERAVWPLLDVLDGCLGEPWLATVAGHLGAGADGRPDDVRRSRRFATARHVSDLFDRYAIHRPGMIRAWAAGDDVTATGQHLPEPHRWQAELWRRLRRRIGSASPAERLAGACDRLVGEPALVDLPDRLSVFGLTRLPATFVDVLRALAANRDVHLFLLHPSAVLWQRVAPLAGGTGAVRRRVGDPTAEAAANPLLRAWGRDAREMQLVLGTGGARGADTHHRLDAPEPETLLQRIQRAVRDDVAPPGEARVGGPDERPVLSSDDRSLQVHACHGRARQVEVVRDAILHLLDDDPTLEARDVIVMCPDIETFAPLIHATFGAGEGVDDDEPGETASVDLRVRLADRSLRQTNPLLGAVAALLALADARVTATEVLDFAGRDAVRRRFALDDDDLARLKEWVSATGIRWGFDGPHRTAFKLHRIEQNTWRAGLDRVLVGVTMAEDGQRLVDGVLPLDDVESGAIDLAGRFAELVDRLHTAVLALQQPMALSAWVRTVGDAADALLAVSDRDAWQRAQLGRLLDDLVAEASVDGATSAVELSLGELRSLLADRLRGRPTRANFRTGHLTVCTLVPMRSVPHRVVCLLGLDDGSFPRKAEPDGDDLVALDPCVGDGDGRSEDRQLLLDALLAATDHLVVTYSGHDERTNAELPPAVPVGELLDVVDATVRAAGGGASRARDAIVVHHPLQPFDPRNFEPGRLVAGPPWSFDPVTLEGAQALQGHRPAATAFLSGPLPPPDPSPVVELDALVRFVQHPIRAFLRQRLGISLADFSEEIDDAIPVELDPLEKWSVGDRILAARLAGVPADVCVEAERARGSVPPGRLADRALDEIHDVVEVLVREAGALGTGDVDSVEVSVRLDDGRLLTGTVPGVIGTCARSVIYSKVGPKHRLAGWARFLALTAGRAGDGFEVVTVGRARKKCRDQVVTVSRFAPRRDRGGAEAWARHHLHVLVDLYDRGMREPLPVFCASSAAYAAAVADGADGVAAASKEWQSAKFPGEDRDPEHRLVLGGVVPFDTVFALAPAADEDGDGWPADEMSRFGRCARRLWSGLLGAERLEDS